MKIIFKSLYIGCSHIHFESSIIQLYMGLYPDADFIFVGNKQQVKNVLNLVNDGFKVRRIVSSAKSRKRLSFFYFKKTLFSRHEIIRVDLSGILPSCFYFLGALQDHIYQHQLFVSPRYVSKFLSLLNFNLTFLLNIFFSIKIITLGPWIYDNYQRNVFFLYMKKSFYYIGHPYLISNSTHSINYPGSTSVFGFLGFQKAVYKSLSLKDFLKIQNLILNFGGKIVETSDNYIPENDYTALFHKCHYSVILYLANYKYACSGVFIESIVYKKPIICLSSDIANYFFDKYGDLGFKFDSIEQLEVGIKNIILHPSSLRYSKFVRNLEKAASDFTDRSKLEKSLSKILFI